MEDLERSAALGQDASATVASVNKGKRKLGEVPANLWGRVEGGNDLSSIWDVANVTRSGRVFQPSNLQAGSSSNPPMLRAVPAAHRNVPIVPNGVLEADAIQKQLERIPATVSIWGLISSSKEHREKLSSALARLKVPTDITPEAKISLILPLLSKHSVTFSERDLPV